MSCKNNTRTALENMWRWMAAAVLACLSAVAVQAQVVEVGADAGPDRMTRANVPVALDGSGSTLLLSEDAPESQLGYSWSVSNGADGVRITGSDTPRPVVVADGAGRYEITLTISAGEATASDTVLVDVDADPEQVSPTAMSRKSLRGTVGAPSVLDATESFSPSGTRLAFNWTVAASPEGSTAQPLDGTSAVTAFTPDVEGTYRLEVTVTDENGRQSVPAATTVSTGNVAPLAQIGHDRVADVGTVVVFDAEGTVDANGDRLDARWSIISRPDGSEAQLVETVGGRQSFEVDVPGFYVLQLVASDETRVRGIDTALVVARSSDTEPDPIVANRAPVANAGPDAPLRVGADNILDASRSTDIDGSALTYRWSVLSAPAGSSPVLQDERAVRAVFTSDTPGLHILQLAVTDTFGEVDYDTVLLRTGDGSPVANAGGPEAGTDGAIIDATATVDGSQSTQTFPNTAPPSYMWSVLGLAPGRAEITDAASARTDIAFPEGGAPAALASDDAKAGLDLFRSYSLVSFGNTNAYGTIQGRTLIGGSLGGTYAKFATAYDTSEHASGLSVAGDIIGKPKRVYNGADVGIGGRRKTRIYKYGGGRVFHDTGVSARAHAAKVAAKALSSELSSLPPTGDYVRDSADPSTIRLTAQPDANGVAVFTFENGSSLFSNRSVRTLDIDMNGAEVVVVNVAGRHIEHSKLRFSQRSRANATSTKVIWNFHQASAVKLWGHFEGSVLAPHALVKIGSRIDGSVVSAYAWVKGLICYPRFDGSTLEEGGESAHTSYALAQLEVTAESGARDYDTVVLTTGNRRPVARITGPAPSTQTMPGAEIELRAGLSSDPDGNLLDYRWSVLSQPGSALALGTPQSPTQTLTLDTAGTYVFQLVASDAELSSRPVTYVVSVENSKPIAVAGEDQTLFVGDTAQLDGSASSDPDGEDLTYSWVLTDTPEGSAAVLSTPNRAITELRVDTKGDYVVSLVVDDGVNVSVPDIVTLNVPNRAPIAVVNAAETGMVGSRVALTSEGSDDPDGDTLNYLWSLSGPSGSGATLSGIETPEASFVPDVEGNYTVSLIVDDGEDASPKVSREISATRLNRPPNLASVEGGEVRLGTSRSVTLSASDPDGDPVTYSVSSSAGSSAFSLDAATGLFMFTPQSRRPEQVGFTFIASDGQLQSTQTAVFTVLSDDDGTTRFEGRVIDADTGEPLSGMKVMAEGTDIATVTDADGAFTLVGLSKSVVICVESPDGAGEVYAPAVFSRELIENALNTEPDPILLKRASASVEYDASVETVLRSDDPDDLGIEFRIAQGSFDTVGARYWRVVVEATSDPSERAAIGELRFENSGALQPVAFTASSRWRRSSAADRIGDGDPGTAWSPSPKATPGEWVSADFGAGNQVVVQGLEYTNWGNYESGTRQGVIRFGVEFSNDSLVWERLRTIETSDWNAGETRRFSMDNIASGTSISLTTLSGADLSALPDGIVPCKAFSIGTKNLMLDAPVTLLVDNFDSLPADSTVDVWAWQGGAFRIFSEGRVGDDGAQIEASLPNLAAGVPIIVSPKRHVLVPTADQPGAMKTNTMFVNGAYGASYALAGYGSLGGADTTGFIYNSRSADSSHVLAVDADFGKARPETVTTTVTLNGTTLDFRDTLSISEQGSVRQEALVPATGLPAGNYPAVLESTATYACSQVTSRLFDTLPVTGPSPYGTGWQVAEIQTLRPTDDGGAVIFQPDGSTLRFEPETPFVFEDFEDGFGGWGVVGLSRGLSYNAEGGNPGGHIQEVDRLSSAGLVYWRAPDRLAQQLQDFIGGEFAYDIRQKAITRQVGDDDDLRIETSTPDRLVFDYPDSQFPGTAWTRFTFPLTHDGGWKIRRADDTLEDPTEEEFRDLIGKATRLSFRAEHRNGDDTVYLDNATLGAQSVENRPGQRISTSFKTVNGDFSTLTLREGGGFERRYPDGTLVEFDVEGRQTAVVDTNGNRTSYAYDDRDRVQTITDPGGQVTRFVFVGDNLSSVVDPAGRETFFGYNDNDQLVRIENPEGEIQAYGYDDNSRLISQTDPDGHRTRHSYSASGFYEGSDRPDGTSIRIDIARGLGLDDLGTPDAPRDPIPESERVTRHVDGRGNASVIETNAFGGVIRKVDALGRETVYERDGDNRVTVIIAPSGVTPSETLRTELTYDDRGNVTSRRDAVGTVSERLMSYAYEPELSRLVRQTDADGFETSMVYDDRGNLLRVVDPLGGEEVYTYDERGLKLSGTDKNGNVTLYAYDEFGRLERSTDPSGNVTRLVLDAAGNIAVRIEAEGEPEERRTAYGYDAQDRMVLETAADGGTTTYAHDDRGNTVSITDPTQVTETRTYDERGRLVSVFEPAMGATSMAYDEDGNLVRTTDAAGQTTEYTYDAVDRLESTVDARGQLRAFLYDVRDNITAVTDARANITRMDYDALDRPVRRSNPVGDLWQFAYDGRDNRVSATKPDGVAIASTYDGLSRLTALSGGGTASVERSYAYDAQGNVLSADVVEAGVAGVSLAFAYDGENRLASATTSNLFGAGAANNRFAYAYDALDRRASMGDGFGGRTGYGYDGVDRLVRIDTPTGGRFDTEFDLAGRRLGRVSPNTVRTQRSYEALTGRLSAQSQLRTVAGGDEAAFDTLDYAYTERGNIAKIGDVSESGVVRQTAYDYDELERLTQAAVSVDGAVSQGASESYVLDPEGNREVSHISDTHVTDAANRLTSDARYTYAYDPNGNLTSKTPVAVNDPSWTYTYDAFDQLVEVARDGVVVEGYGYDAFGRRSRIDTSELGIVGGSTAPVDARGLASLGVINDGPDRALDVVANDNGAGDNGTGGNVTTLLRRYTHDAQIDSPLELEVTAAANDRAGTYTYHTDHLGSVRMLTDINGDVASAYRYDSYGRPTLDIEGVAQPFGYTARERDRATGLYHHRARAYDPSTGRFLQEDPLGFGAGDLNIYRYVLSNPLTYTDPLGLSATGENAGTAGIGLGSAGGMLATGMRLNCLFTALSVGVGLVSEHLDETGGGVSGLDIIAGGAITALECGAKIKFKKKPKRKVCNKTGGSKSCFAAGTPVHTRDPETGEAILLPIEKIEPGMEVKSLDVATGEVVYKPVIARHVNRFDAPGTLVLEREVEEERTASLNHTSLPGERLTIRVTRDHPMHHATRGWVHASKLQVGDRLTGDEPGETFRVVEADFTAALAPHATPSLTYNLSVADTHTYFVGEDGVLVHNGRGFILKPNPAATGPHSTWNPRGPSYGYATWDPNPCNPTGWDQRLRYRGTGKPHGPIRPPIAYPKGGPGRPAQPGEIPKGF